MRRRRREVVNIWVGEVKNLDDILRGFHRQDCSFFDEVIVFEIGIEEVAENLSLLAACISPEMLMSMS